MAIVNRIDINVLSLIILALILYHTSKRAEPANVQHGLFVGMALALGLILAADSISWIIDGMQGSICRILNWAVTLLIYLPIPFIPSIYILYADFQVCHDVNRIRRLAWPLAAYILLDAAFNLSSIWTGWSFTINGGNFYHRGPYVAIHTLSCYACFAYVTVFILLNRKRIEKRRFVTLLTFAVPPAAAGLVQGLFYGVDLIWGAFTLSLLLLYINIQDKQLDTDYLTGIYNRRLLDSYVGDRIKSSAKGKTFSAILIDLDNFKYINDSFGHDAGDDALLDVVALLKGCLRHGDMITRYGGDEFLIILDIGTLTVLEETIERLKCCFDRYNKNSGKPYELKFSTGYAVYDMSCGMDPEQFIKHIDKLMYEDKKRSYAASPPIAVK